MDTSRRLQVSRIVTAVSAVLVVVSLFMSWRSSVQHKAERQEFNRLKEQSAAIAVKLRTIERELSEAKDEAARAEARRKLDEVSVQLTETNRGFEAWEKKVQE